MEFDGSFVGAYRISCGNPALVVRAKGSASESGPPVSIELGLQYRRRGEVDWTRANASLTHESICSNAGEAWFFNSKAASGSGSEAVFICNSPRAGDWEVRAYSVLHSAEEAIDDASDPFEQPLKIQLEVLGAARPAFNSSMLIRSAQFTEPLFFEVVGARR